MGFEGFAEGHGCIIPLSLEFFNARKWASRFSYRGGQGLHVIIELMTSFFNPAGPVAAAQAHLIELMVGLMLIIVVPMFILLFTFARRYRAGNKKLTAKDYEPEHASRAAWSQLVLWAIPAALIVVLGVLNWQSAHALDPQHSLDPSASAVAAGDGAPLVIEVVALPWKWLFIYPAQNIATVNIIKFPAGEPVHFELTADAPMSSFWIPQLGSQIYAMAAMMTQLNLLASTTGEYTGRDTEINGEGYAGMTFEADSVTPGDFAAWVAEVQGSVAGAATSTSTSTPLTYPPLTLDIYNALAAPSENNPVAYYSSVAPGLFGGVMMKYMMPMPGMNMTTGTMIIATSSTDSSGTMQGMPGMEM
jgi:cytochrome o ubiquinol oxidase subunit 2